MEQLFEQLDATHPVPAHTDQEETRTRSYQDPLGRTALAVFFGGLVLGLVFTLARRRD
jgi:hypothetical protein